MPKASSQNKRGWLAAAGRDYAQGYFFSWALSSEGLEQWLKLSAVVKRHVAWMPQGKALGLFLRIQLVVKQRQTTSTKGGKHASDSCDIFALADLFYH